MLHAGHTHVVLSQSTRARKTSASIENVKEGNYTKGTHEYMYPSADIAYKNAWLLMSFAVSFRHSRPALHQACTASFRDLHECE